MMTCPRDPPQAQEETKKNPDERRKRAHHPHFCPRTLPRFCPARRHPIVSLRLAQDVQLDILVYRRPIPRLGAQELPRHLMEEGKGRRPLASLGQPRLPAS
jgi:hypothetical protein